jgi:hypothetical protein
MAGEHAEIAFRPRHVDLFDVAGEDELLGGYEFEVERHDQAASAASFLPFSTASSMVPTM